jgi:hypothetical protein
VWKSSIPDQILKAQNAENIIYYQLFIAIFGRRFSTRENNSILALCLADVVL